MPPYPVIIEVILAKILFSKLKPIQSYGRKTLGGRLGIRRVNPGQIKTQAVHFWNFPQGLLCMRNLAFHLQYLFVTINKISTRAPHQWWLLSGLGVGVVITGRCMLEVRVRVEILTNLFSVTILSSVLLGLMDFSDMVILRGRPNSCCQKTLSVLICFYYPQVCFHERVEQI